MRLEDFVERSGSDFVSQLRNIVKVSLSAASPCAEGKVKELRKDAGKVRHTHEFATQYAFDESMNTHHALLVLLTAVIFAPFTVFSQGSLAPSGPPTPSMKTLEQIEPRTVISSVPYTINQPGSYYLTNNLYGVSSDYGIQIFANNVTVDLNGFTLRGVTNAFDGVVTYQSSSNVTVCNGMISGWGQG